MTSRSAKLLSVSVAALLGGAALAGDLPRLPRDLPLPQTGDSPGVVTFRHESHVDATKPGCTTCHPRLFGILGRSSSRRDRIVTHAAMKEGGACGACHGKQAFDLEDCTMCHAM